MGTLVHVDKVDLLGPSFCAVEAEGLSLSSTFTGDCGDATPSPPYMGCGVGFRGFVCVCVWGVPLPLFGWGGEYVPVAQARLTCQAVRALALASRGAEWIPHWWWSTHGRSKLATRSSVQPNSAGGFITRHQATCAISAGLAWRSRGFWRSLGSHLRRRTSWRGTSRTGNDTLTTIVVGGWLSPRG